MVAFDFRRAPGDEGPRCWPARHLAGHGPGRIADAAQRLRPAREAPAPKFSAEAAGAPGVAWAAMGGQRHSQVPLQQMFAGACCRPLAVGRDDQLANSLPGTDGTRQ